MFAELATLAVLISEPVRYRRGRGRYKRYRVERLEKEPPCCWPKLERQPRIEIITPTVNPNTFNERFGDFPAKKGDKVK